MVRMANCYSEEGNLESAFIIYMKFIVYKLPEHFLKLLFIQITFRLFLEKMRSHPDLAAVSQADRDNNKKKLKEILPIAEKIKTQLTARFAEEHEQYKV
jgi:STAM-binding protein